MSLLKYYQKLDDAVLKLEEIKVLPDGKISKKK